MREYRIYLPLKYNDGTTIEEDKFRNIKIALVDEFGAITVVLCQLLTKVGGNTAVSNTWMT